MRKELEGSQSAAAEAWGQGELASHQRFVQRKISEEYREEARKDDERMLRMPLQRLFVVDGNQTHIPEATERFFREAVAQRIVTKEDMRSSFELEDGELLYRALSGALPTEVIVKLMIWRNETLEKQNTEWQERFRNIKDEYKVRLATAIAEGLIPEGEHYGERLDKAQLLVQDPLGVDKAGEYKGGLVVEVLVEGRKISEIRKTIFHELNHFLAGKNHIEKQTIEERQIKIDGAWRTERFLVPEYRKKKEGLSFEAHHKAKRFGLAPNWLNEGVTEMLARHMAGITEETSYRAERSAIQTLIDQGVSFRLFVHAYFESLDPQNKERGYPAFRALNERIVALRGKGWLNRIQQEVNEVNSAQKKLGRN